MSDLLFTFDESQYREQFARLGYVHIKKGVSDQFLKVMTGQVAEYMASRRMETFRIGDKEQAMYEFPPDGDYLSALKRTVGAVSGLDPEDLVLSERHIKGYEATANPRPLAHKDRFASEISVGISVTVKEGSTLVLYPADLTDVNPFNASTLLRNSLSTDRYPEAQLSKGTRIEIHDAPGDVIIFRGHRFWHLRENPANTTMLYLKLNALNCDPLGEDPTTPVVRSYTEAALTRSDEELMELAPMIGRRVDYVHRMCNRNWEEVTGVVLWGQTHFTIDDQELAIMKAADGSRNLRSILASVNGHTDTAEVLRKVRRIAQRGIIDLRDKKAARIEI